MGLGLYLGVNTATLCPPQGGGGGGSGGGGWLNWLYRKGKNEAHLPDDKNKSVSWIFFFS